MSGDERKPNPTPGQLAALNAFQVPAMSRQDLELNVRGSILDALVETSPATGIVAGEAAELLLEEVYKSLFGKRRRWTIELALRISEEEIAGLRADLARALEVANRSLDIADGALEHAGAEFPELRP